MLYPVLLLQLSGPAGSRVLRRLGCLSQCTGAWDFTGVSNKARLGLCGCVGGRGISLPSAGFSPALCPAGFVLVAVTLLGSRQAAAEVQEVLQGAELLAPAGNWGGIAGAVGQSWQEAFG